MIISIVGKSGSGKSSISKYLEELDGKIMHIDVDKISHYVLTIPEVINKLRESFGEEIVLDGMVNRKTLGEIVFSSCEYMDKLTDITWPFMEKIIDKIIDDNKDKVILLDWLLIPKTKYFQDSSLKIWVEVPFDERFMRAYKRSNSKLEYDYFLKRDLAGIDYEEGVYDFVVNNGDIKETKRKVEKIYEKCIISR